DLEQPTDIQVSKNPSTVNINSSSSDSSSSNSTMNDLAGLLVGHKVGTQFAYYMAPIQDATNGNSPAQLIMGTIVDKMTQDEYAQKQSEQEATSDPSKTPVTSDLPENVPTVNVESGTPEISIPDTFKDAGVGDSVIVNTIEEGTGDAVALTDTVSTNYSGWLLDGTQFDSSWKDGKTTPVDLPLNQVIPGWAAAMNGHKVGAKLLVMIPSKYGYGDQATGSIPKNSDLIFYIEITGRTAGTSSDTATGADDTASTDTGEDAGTDSTDTTGSDE
ncbi:MAG: FKBP-type peptidyl-prolyl cis-trans isomerase, partial [Candidatus Ancillula sp.]|nr:FKBP-type peptidyl-prolyl cis-trans isomerase [Candidatus Ancillula sp.]